MESLRLSGLATGMDTSSIIEQLMAIERRPVRMMQSRQAAERSVLDHLRALNTKLSALQTSAKNLVGTSLNLSPLSAKTATSSNTAIYTATADSTASSGTYSIDVTRLAREQKTGAGTFSSPASAGQIRITKDSDGSFKDVAIAAGATAANVAKAINDANAGMSATVIDGKLMLTGRQTGESFTVDDGDANNDGVPDGNLFATSLGIDSATKTFQTAQQAEIVIDGQFTVTSKTNKITNALPGVTINAAALGTATLTVSRDDTKSVDAVKDFLGKYNDVVNQIKNDTKYDAEKKKGGPLTGDAFVSNLTVQLNRHLTTEFEMYDAGTGTYGVDADYHYYSDIGIQVQRDGTLTLDETKFKAALEKDPAKVHALLGQEDSATTTDGNGHTVRLNTNRDGIAKRLEAFVDGLVNSSSQYNYTKDASGARYEGSMLTRINGGEKLITQYDDRIEAYERRLELRERTIRGQFLAMEKAVAMLRNQGNYMAGQFAQMAGGQ